MSYLDVSTLTAELTAINSAILALLQGGAKSYMLGDRQVTKLDLKELCDRRDKLVKQLNTLEGGTTSRRLMTFGTWRSNR